LIKDFLAKEQCDNNGATPIHPPDQVVAEFYLFARNKSVSNRRRLCDATGMIKNATEELKILSQNGFQGMFPTVLQSLAQMYSCTVGLF